MIPDWASQQTVSRGYSNANVVSDLDRNPFRKFLGDNTGVIPGPELEASHRAN